jgi:hypothetical protein
MAMGDLQQQGLFFCDLDLPFMDQQDYSQESSDDLHRLELIATRPTYYHLRPVLLEYEQLGYKSG